MRPVSLTDALRPRAVRILAALAARERHDSEPRLGHFSGFQPGEGLDGSLSRFQDGLIVEYWRHGMADHPAQPRLRLVYPRMTAITEQHREPPVVIERDIQERQDIELDIPAGVQTTDTYRVEFERTCSFEAAARRAWEVAAKASLAVEISGVKAAAEISGKYGEDYARKDAGSETHRDVKERVFTFTGPLKTRLVGMRAHNRERTIVTALCDFDFQVALDPGGDFSGIVYWASFRADFLPVARGVAPREDTWAREFTERPLSDAELAALEAPGDKAVQFEVEYDAIMVRSLKRADE